MLAGQAGARSSSWEAGAGGGQLVLRLPPPPPPSTDTGHLPSFPHLAAPVSPRSGSQVQLLFGSPRGESEHRGVAARGSADLRSPRPAGGPGRTWPPPSAPAGGASRSAFPHRPFRQGQTVSIPGLGLPGPSGFTSDKWEFSGAVSPAPRKMGLLGLPGPPCFPESPSLPPPVPPCRLSHLFSRFHHFFNLFDRHLLRTYCVPGRVVGTRLM